MGFFLSFHWGHKYSLPLGLVRGWSSDGTLCWGEGPAASVPEASDWSLSILFTLGKVLVLLKSEDLIRSSLARLWDCGPELHSEKVQRASRESGLVYPTLTLSAPVLEQTGVLLSPPHGWGASHSRLLSSACLSAFHFHDSVVIFTAGLYMLDACLLERSLY